MALTPQQQATLKADIIANGDLNSQPNNSDGAFEIARLYNLLASPDYWVWRTSVSKAELVQTTSVDGTTFSWVGTGFITRSQGERDAWRELFNDQGLCNPSLASVRTSFTDIFSGATAPAPANRTHLAAIGRRKCTRVEKLFAVDTPGSGAGRGTTADPDTMGFEGPLSYQDVELARQLP